MYVDSLLKPYSEGEKVLIMEDLSLIRKLAFSKCKNKNKKPVYLATAGGPLSRKSTILEKALAEDSKYKDAVYLDPDQRGLKFMVNTYIARGLSNYKIYQTFHEEKKTDIQSVRKDAYDYWRSASNYITNTLINEAVEQRCDLAHGTTLTGGASPKLLKGLKDRGYEIQLLLAFAPQKFKESALKFRDEKQGFYQASPEDIFAKAYLFKERIPDYFDYADFIEIYWTESLQDTILPVAQCKRTASCTVKNQRDFEKIKNFHPKWESLTHSF